MANLTLNNSKQDAIGVFAVDAKRTLYSATFSAVAATAAQDCFEIVAPDEMRVKITEVRLGQYTDFGDAAAEILSVLIIRGHTVGGSGGTSVTPKPLKSWESAASSLVEANNTTLASGGASVTLISDAWNIASSWVYSPPLSEEVWLEAGERAVVRITVPADSITINGTLIFEERHADLE